jgi:hypothetical protein
MKGDIGTDQRGLGSRRRGSTITKKISVTIENLSNCLVSSSVSMGNRLFEGHPCFLSSYHILSYRHRSQSSRCTGSKSLSCRESGAWARSLGTDDWDSDCGIRIAMPISNLCAWLGKPQKFNLRGDKGKWLGNPNLSEFLV